MNKNIKGGLTKTMKKSYRNPLYHLLVPLIGV